MYVVVVQLHEVVPDYGTDDHGVTIVYEVYSSRTCVYAPHNNLTEYNCTELKLKYQQ